MSHQAQVVFFTIITLIFTNKLALAIDCFKCISINKDYLPCEDPFHNNYTTDIYESPCMGGRKGRDGLFPATSCVKITGIFAVLCYFFETFLEDNGESITLRGCALDSGTLTTDTEIVRMSHCGGLYYANRYIKGCVQSCNDADACNHTGRSKIYKMFYYSELFVIITVNLLFCSRI